MKITIPPRLGQLLNVERTEEGKTIALITKFEDIFVNNRLEFFPEYTDHGVEHINGVLSTVEQLISDSTWQHLNARDISVLIQAVVLHDLGMHISPSLFVRMISSETILIPELDQRSWKDTWNEYLREAVRFSDWERRNFVGTDGKPASPDFDNLTEVDRRLIGEFIRRHHPRICHEISLGASFLFYEKHILDPIMEPKLRSLAGLVGRSHGMNLRDTFSSLQSKYFDSWKNPYDIKIIYLMALIRIADYLQIHPERASPLLYRIRDFKSPLFKT